MATRTVRLDDEAEGALREVRERTGLSISDALKAGILALREWHTRGGSPSAFDIYQELDLGPGGYSHSPSDDTRSGVQEVLRKRSGR